MEFVIAIEPGGKDQAFGVVVPDLPGCYSAGDTFADALGNAREAIVLHLEELGARGIEVVVPQGVEVHVGNPDFKGWLWGFVDVDDRLLSDKVERINITVPSRKLSIIDRAASGAGKARSEYLVETALDRALEALQKVEVRDTGKRGRVTVNPIPEPRASVIHVHLDDKSHRRRGEANRPPPPSLRKTTKPAASKARRKAS